MKYAKPPILRRGLLHFGILNSIKGIAQKLKKGASSMTEQNAIFRLTV